MVTATTDRGGVKKIKDTEYFLEKGGERGRERGREKGKERGSEKRRERRYTSTLHCK